MNLIMNGTQLFSKTRLFLMSGSLLLGVGACQKKSETPPTPIASTAISTAVSSHALVEEKRYQIQLEKEEGQKAKRSIHVLPKAPYHLNQSYPTSLTLQLVNSQNEEKTILTPKDGVLTEKELRLPAPMMGHNKVSADLRFAVCTETTCEPVKASLVLEAE